ncbi:MAG: hypothetical protein N4A74_02670 [Carboxylicivirga sp.]|jgi:hypothetical protein|nr:hypothetical protein [Carboxylicivirga sp.]
MEDIYPKSNPAHGLNQFIEQKMRKLDTIDKNKYAGYYKQTCAEIREIEYHSEGLNSLKNFDLLVDIQKAIDHHQDLDTEVLTIKIPLAANPHGTHMALLDFTEGRQHD